MSIPEREGRWCGSEFEFVCELDPMRNGDKVAECWPHLSYRNAKHHQLLEFGAGPFCEVSIPRRPKQTGVFILESDGQVLYAGGTGDLSKRWNTGIGRVSPRNCFKGGRAANCRLNRLILDAFHEGCRLCLWFCPTRDRKGLEYKITDALAPAWNVQSARTSARRDVSHLTGELLEEEIERCYLRLRNAVINGRSKKTCLRLWSELIRTRDGFRCVDCHATEDLAAHHICRKAFFPLVSYAPGNGITLCPSCHEELHQGFNGQPDMNLPMDSEDGEKLGLMERMYWVLLNDAEERGLDQERYYEVHESILETFKKLQGFDPSTPFPGTSLRQATLIWSQSSPNVRDAILTANGFKPMGSVSLEPGVHIYYD